MTAVRIGEDRIGLRLAPLSARSDIAIERDITAHLEDGIQRARVHLLAGRPGRALYELTRSLERQARVAGLGAIPITDAPCPCGGGQSCPKDYRHQVPFLHPEAAR